MTSSETRLAVIVPTRNRPQEVATLLASLRKQTRRPDSVVVIDSSDAALRSEVRQALADTWPEAHYEAHWPPSAAAQRNRGLDLVLGDCDLVALLDDDVTLPADALECACHKIAQAESKFIGFGFNPVDEDALRGYGALKSLRLTEKLGLYSARVGAINQSGWHSRLVHVDQPTEVEWLGSLAVIWRAEAIKTLRFDEFFEKYSYLEDVDMSLQARQLGHLLILREPTFLHEPAPGGRGSRFWFGRIEIRNRHYIVKKHHLSLWRFWLGAAIRSGMTFASGLTRDSRELGRFFGNVSEAGRLMFAKRPR